MKRTIIMAALAMAAALQATAVPAAGNPMSSVSELRAPAITPGVQNDSASATAFTSSVCRVPAETRSEMAEMGAFEQWQGAATAPAGHSEPLVYGAMLQDVGLEPVIETRSGVGAQADTDAETDATRDDSQARERRRMFLLGLAILLNINAKQ